MPHRPLRLTVLSLLWLGVLMGLLKYGAQLLPGAVAQRLTVEGYSSLVQLVAMGFGLGLSYGILDTPRRDLGLEAAGRGRGVLFTALLAPAAYVAICYAAVGLALPTLREELARGGVALVRSQGGAIISAMTGSGLLVPLLWAVVVSPLGEELLFRGALWGAAQDLLLRAGSATGSRDLESEVPLERSLLFDVLGWTIRSGTAATLLTTAIFAALHADLRGSQGIVRVASAAGLALVCGVARQSTGTLAAPLVLHVLLNALALASARRWVVSETFPKHYTVPTLVTLMAAVGLVCAAGVAIAERKASSHTAERDR